MTYSGTYAVVLALHLITVAFLVGPAAVAGMIVATSNRDMPAAVTSLRFFNLILTSPLPPV